MRGPKNSLIKMPDSEASELQTPEAERARKLDVKELADAIQEVGFECTECGDCCTSGSDDDPNENVVTVFPDEVRRISDNNDLKKDEIAEPNPFGGEETFEWALKRDGCGDCFFYENECGIYEDRPWICRTYPFDVSWEDSVSSTEKRHLSDSTLLVYECEGTGRGSQGKKPSNTRGDSRRGRSRRQTKPLGYLRTTSLWTRPTVT